MKLNCQKSASPSEASRQIPLPCSSGDFSTSRGPELARNLGDQEGESRRREFRWSKAARELVRAHRAPRAAELSALLTPLGQEPGTPRWACRRFARGVGI